MSQARRYAAGVLGRALRGLALCAALSLARCGAAAAQDDGLIPGLSGWAEAVSRASSSKWVGQRVPDPLPVAAPISTGRVDSALWPVRVHMTRAPTRAELRRARAALDAAEQTLQLGADAGLFTLIRPLDLYLVDSASTGAFADVQSVWSELDSVHAFACVDARTPALGLSACVAEALIEAQLLALDPAESPSIRRASAAYFGWLIQGGVCDPQAPQPQLSFDQQQLLHTPAALQAWLRALGEARDQGRGVFVENMWQFARQQTWEGRGLRGSPDLIEAITKAFELGHERLEEMAAALAARAALASAAEPLSNAAAVRYSALPAHLAPSAPLSPLDASLRLIDLERPRPGERIAIWSRGESGVRWALGATRLRADGSVIAQQAAAVLKVPDAELQVELDAETRFVLVAVVNMAQGMPDPDLGEAGWERSVRIIVDRGK